MTPDRGGSRGVAPPGQHSGGQHSFEVFGTTAVLIVTRPAKLGRARAIADAELAAVDRACSRFRPDSELSMLNGARGELTEVSGLFATLIAQALRAAELTDGAVTPTCAAALVAAGYDRDLAAVLARGGDPPQPPAVLARGGTASAAPGAVPSWRDVWLDPDRRLVRLAHGAELDLGSTAKAWAADHCAGLIARTLDCGVLVSLGGDVAVAGPPPGDGWQIRATDDHAAPADAPGQTVTIRSGGLATSSTTVRTWTSAGRTRHHIIDPVTGEPADSCWRTVSVAAGTCLDANIASTASIIKGPAAIDWLTRSGLPARLVSHAGVVTTTPSWPSADVRHDSKGTLLLPERQ
jgi:FAD:protein FMN transferase